MANRLNYRLEIVESANPGLRFRDGHFIHFNDYFGFQVSRTEDGRCPITQSYAKVRYLLRQFSNDGIILSTSLLPKFIQVCSLISCAGHFDEIYDSIMESKFCMLDKFLDKHATNKAKLSFEQALSEFTITHLDTPVSSITGYNKIQIVTNDNPEPKLCATLFVSRSNIVVHTYTKDGTVVCMTYYGDNKDIDAMLREDMLEFILLVCNTMLILSGININHSVAYPLRDVVSIDVISGPKARSIIEVHDLLSEMNFIKCQ